MTRPHSNTAPRRQTLGALLRDAREQVRLTQGQLGQRLALANGNFIGMVERDERTPSDALLRQWCAILEVDERVALQAKLSAAGRGAAANLLNPPDARRPTLRALLNAVFASDEEVLRTLSATATSPFEDHLAFMVIGDAILPALSTAPDDAPLHALAGAPTDLDAWEQLGAALLVRVRSLPKLRFDPRTGGVGQLGPQGRIEPLRPSPGAATPRSLRDVLLDAGAAAPLVDYVLSTLPRGRE